MSTCHYPVSALPPKFDRAACRANPELFDPIGDREDRDDADERQEKARALCQTCPAREQCFTWAIESHHDPRNIVGPVLGGYTSGQRWTYRTRNKIPNPPRINVADLYSIVFTGARQSDDHDGMLCTCSTLFRCRPCDAARKRSERARRRVA